MHSVAVVPHGNVVHDILLRLVTRLVVAPLHTLLFQAAEEALCHGSSQPKRPPPQLLTEPYVNLSAHTALVIQPPISKFASEETATVIDDTTPVTTFLISSYDASEAYVFALPTS